jgi:hypothetical protein
MIEDICRKLREHLKDHPIETECSVVYLLAEVRKVIDKEKPRPWPLTLWLHCNWALHVDLGQPNTTIDLLRKIDAFVLNKNIIGLPKPDGKFTFIDEHYLSKELVFLENFRQELESFFLRHDINTDLCKSDKLWFSFIAAYAGVIEDGTLSIGKTDKLRAIEEVRFSKGRPTTQEHHLPFAIHWDVLLKDGRSLELEVKSVPGAPADSFMHSIMMKLNPARIRLQQATRQS